ncbi:MAG TPA: biotin synthase BioB [Anaerohalosphaeraceae bacterium]|nr:biotin synthase BioB [Anaerohalosphaeraceae bacterium]
MNKTIQHYAECILDGQLLQRPDIETLSELSKEHLDDLLYWANQIRKANFGNQVRICSIVPGRLGGCSQDCAFCAQSIRYDTPVDKTPKTLSDEEIIAAAAEAKHKGVPNFGIVYSGRKVSDAELDRLIELTKRIKSQLGLGVCMGLGVLDEASMQRLAAAGVSRFNHNLETSRRHFKDIVTTHCYEDRVKTIQAALKAGLGVCAGGIFGIGETEDDRIDMAVELGRLGVDMVPMNFLHPIPGTPLGNTPALPPREILRIIALYRFILPKTHLKVAGGRVLNLRDMQSWIFYAGCTSILTGNYLTTAGRAVEDDLRMLKDLGLETA